MPCNVIVGKSSFAKMSGVMWMWIDFLFLETLKLIEKNKILHARLIVVMTAINLSFNSLSQMIDKNQQVVNLSDWYMLLN